MAETPLRHYRHEPDRMAALDRLLSFTLVWKARHGFARVEWSNLLSIGESRWSNVRAV
jgi:hypothetical protein